MHLGVYTVHCSTPTCV